MTHNAAVTLSILAMAMAAPSQDSKDKKDEKKYYTSYLGKAPPKLTIGEKDWINTKAPLTLEGLKGKVVWLEFSYTH